MSCVCAVPCALCSSRGPLPAAARSPPGLPPLPAHLPNCSPFHPTGVAGVAVYRWDEDCVLIAFQNPLFSSHKSYMELLEDSRLSYCAVRGTIGEVEGCDLKLLYVISGR